MRLAYFELSLVNCALRYINAHLFVGLLARWAIRRAELVRLAKKGRVLMMRRIIMLVTVALMMVAMAAPAFAVTRAECVHNVIDQVAPGDQGSRGYLIRSNCVQV
jgi:uncharacterized membrane protein YwzB